MGIKWANIAAVGLEAQIAGLREVSDLLRRQLDDVLEDRDRWRAQAALAQRFMLNKGDRVNYLPRLVVYEQGGVVGTITALSQFSHDPMPMFPCRLMVREMGTVRIIMRVVGRADHKMIARHVVPPDIAERRDTPVR